MPKWADYGISAVQYSTDRTRIVKVKAHQDSGESIGGGVDQSRTEVVNALEAGRSFVTILKGANGWSKGQEVHIVIVNGTKFIRTDKNSKAADNLENLPEF